LKGFASSLTVASPRESRIRMARRVGSASAANLGLSASMISSKVISQTGKYTNSWRV